MKPGLQLQIGQQLTMTPQLQQAIRLLQLSTLDLRQEIQEAIETNPLLELEEDGGLAEESSASGDAERELTEQTENLPDEMVVDTNWDDVYPESAPASRAEGGDDLNWEERSGTTDGLLEHLNWQLNLTPMSDADRLIANALVEAIDDSGYMTSSLEDIAETVRHELEEGQAPDELFPEEDEILAVLHRIQQFDPPGVAARSLGECLAIQIRQLPEDLPWRDRALDLVEHHLGLLESRDYALLRRQLKLSEEQLTAVMALIRALNPSPGENMTSSNTEYVVPDVLVTRRGKRWHVELNNDALPRVRVQDEYAKMAGDSGNDEQGNYLRTRLQEARWFLKSLQSRNETLLKVASRIVQVQQGFFEFGEEAMKPLVLSEIAEAVEMHESTISRVTSNKYMMTPRGIFELKYFFSSHVGTEGGGECSSTAIRAIIRKLVAAENPKKPLSDNKLAKLLQEQGIQVARRTVAKYREALRIPASSERKRLL